MAADASPWLNAKQAGLYLGRSRRFILREIHAGRLRGARVGGRREVITCAAWCDLWVTDQAQPIALHRRTG